MAIFVRPREAANDDAAAKVELRDFLAVNLPRLPEQQRRAVEGLLADQTVAEIAAATGAARRTVQCWLADALSHLRELAQN